MGAGATGRPDAVDGILQQWRRERPDLDLSAMGTFARIALLCTLLGPVVQPVFARHGLRQGEFDVLAALRRSGSPYSLIPSQLAEALMTSRAGMTGRLDRLETAGLVTRSLDPADRRSFRVSLSDRGRQVIDAAVTEHAGNVTELIASLTDEERQGLDRALRTLLRGMA